MGVVAAIPAVTYLESWASPKLVHGRLVVATAAGASPASLTVYGLLVLLIGTCMWVRRQVEGPLIFER